ncbi:FHA domain-containing protein [Teredinibacter sp. KSP-S5-2]|uniref:FHA domain-containing protein n=1 Tax=Teredinibacter sp. KSP-S5-2 TaxID=3034506 RepID=UPI002934B0DC|nr:FHA domain-containing protein [Teredinibacter sp. KSP-S5-2]WNO08363.1 FHA domain-containing protein [Teredinibacter sp. KSP-S5-2]
MATIRRELDGQQRLLRPYHSFGRSVDTNHTLIEGVGCSRNHAIVAWDGEHWKIKDLSTNGTWLNKKKLVPGVFSLLTGGDRIQFGENGNQETWRMVDLDAPVSCLMPVVEGLPTISLFDVEVLPIQSHSIVVYLSDNGEWMCESDDEIRALRTGDQVGVHDTLWEFVEGCPSSATIDMKTIHSSKNIQCIFDVNRNEEHVSLTLIVNGKQFDMGERAHHYLLLLLARQRLDDRRRGLCELDQGWMKKDILIQSLRMKEQHINIHIYRFRKQVAEKLPKEASLRPLIERRPGEIRLAYSELVIQGGFSFHQVPA